MKELLEKEIQILTNSFLHIAQPRQSSGLGRESETECDAVRLWSEPRLNPFAAVYEKESLSPSTKK